MNKILRFFKTDDNSDLYNLRPVLVCAESVAAVDPIDKDKSELCLISGHKITVPVCSGVVYKMLEDVRGNHKILTTPYDFYRIPVMHKYNGAAVMEVKDFTKFYVSGDEIYLFKSGYTYTVEFTPLIYLWLSRSSLTEEKEPQMP